MYGTRKDASRQPAHHVREKMLKRGSCGDDEVLAVCSGYRKIRNAPRVDEAGAETLPLLLDGSQQDYNFVEAMRVGIC